MENNTLKDAARLRGDFVYSDENGDTCFLRPIVDDFTAAEAAHCLLNDIKLLDAQWGREAVDGFLKLRR